MVNPRLPFATRTIIHRIQKSMREEFKPLRETCATRTVPAAETESMGLQADALAPRHGRHLIKPPGRYV
jgi:hypothetical protein